MNTLDFLCPSCGGEITHAERSLQCGSCRREYGFWKGNIPDFAADEDFYYSDFPREALQALLARGAGRGWQQALGEVLPALPLNLRRYLTQMLFTEGQAAWKYLLDLHPQKRVLSCGVGLGSLVISLARSFGEVVGYDLTGEQLELLQLRAAALGMDNITCVRGGDLPRLPFPDERFDTVVLNGVLRWLPESREGNPRRVQLAFLEEVRRVLKPGGECLIGIENRYSFEEFLGQQAPETALAFSSLMPRKIANIYSQKKQGKPYRSYTYSMRGYKKLFREAGLQPAHAFSPYPMYRRFTQILSLSGHGKVHAAFFGGNPNSRKTRLMNSPSFLKLFAPSFFMLAAKGKCPPAFLEQLLGQVSEPLRQALELPAADWQIRSLLVASGNKVLAVIENRAAGQNGHPQAAKAIINIAMNPYANERLSENARILDSLHNNPALPEALRERIPRNYLSGELRGEHYHIEALRPGVPGESIAAGREALHKMLRSAFDHLLMLHGAAISRRVVDDRLLEQQFLQPLREVAVFFGTADQQPAFTRLEARLGEMLLGKTIPLVWRHGDYSLKNILFDPERHTLSGIIDWDLSQKNSLPLLDLLQLLVRRQMVEERKSFSHTLFNYVFPFQFSGFEADLVREYRREIGLEEALVAPLSVSYWISRIHPHVGSFKDLDLPWIEENVAGVLEKLDGMEF